MTQTRAWSWRHAIIKSGLPATTRHVLLTISCFMNELGDGCFPTQEQIAEATGLSDRAVRTHLDIAIEASWLKRQEHGFRGQKWRNHEYSAAWPETQDVEKGAEAASGPSIEGAEPHSEGAERASGKVRNDVPTTSPELSNTTPPERASAREGDFSSIWEGWPIGERPDNRDAAEAAFRKLAPRERMLAIEHAVAYRTLMARRGKPPRIFVYLRSRAFEELDDAPPIDSSGDFIIRPGRPEWPEWLGWFRSNHGERGVESIVRLGFCKVKTRWPQRQTEAA